LHPKGEVSERRGTQSKIRTLENKSDNRSFGIGLNAAGGEGECVRREPLKAI
jgi:hypothetical protein